MGEISPVEWVVGLFIGIVVVAVVVTRVDWQDSTKALTGAIVLIAVIILWYNWAKSD